MSNLPLQFNYIPYPLWRKDVLPILRPAVDAFFRRFYPIDEDRTPPVELDTVARYLKHWRLFEPSQLQQLASMQPQMLPRQRETPVAASSKLRLPAQWEPMEAVLLNFPVIYPPLWTMYAQMVEAITPVADVQITIPGAGWAAGILLYLTLRGKADLSRIWFLDLPADDIWIRDYGPFVGIQSDGRRGILSATYATHAVYPQALDDAMPGRYAAYRDFSYREMPLRTEGGNFITDGAGTLIMTTGVLDSNPHLTRDTLESLLHEYFEFEKLMLTPRLRFETTGHVDMLVKLLDPQTMLLSAPHGWSTGGRLQAALDLLRRETNAQGQRYQITLVPTLPLYYNWFFYPIRRSYTNALTVNGQLLIPVYGVKEDAEALAIYRQIAPEYELCPIDCKIGANGGGAVHCMTKEVAG
jgi:agmatine deiminase